MKIKSESVLVNTICQMFAKLVGCKPNEGLAFLSNVCQVSWLQTMTHQKNHAEILVVLVGTQTRHTLIFSRNSKINIDAWTNKELNKRETFSSSFIPSVNSCLLRSASPSM
jgi:hypothetical protein